MVAAEKNKISIPLKLIFSESGVSKFTEKKKKLQKFMLSNNKPGYGTMIKSCDPSFLQKLIFNGYIWKMEFQAMNTGESSHRKKLIELTRLAARTLLIRQFYNQVRKEIYSSDVIRQWNRNNPTRPIDMRTRFNNEFLENFMSLKKLDIQNISQQIENATFDFFDLQPEIKSDDKETFVNMAHEFVSFLGSETWFLLNLQKDSPAARKLVESIRTILIFFLDKSIVAEYLAFLLVELLVFIRPEIFRNEIASNEEITVQFAYCSKGWKSNDDRLKFDISISDRVMLKKNRIHKAISDRSNEHTNGLSLKQFYEQAENNIAHAGLGLYYLSYLREACTRMDIIFNSAVSQIPGNETEVNLSMRF